MGIQLWKIRNHTTETNTKKKRGETVILKGTMPTIECLPSAGGIRGLSFKRLIWTVFPVCWTTESGFLVIKGRIISQLWMVFGLYVSDMIASFLYVHESNIPLRDKILYFFFFLPPYFHMRSWTRNQWHELPWDSIDNTGIQGFRFNSLSTTANRQFYVLKIARMDSKIWSGSHCHSLHTGGSTIWFWD